MAFEDFLNKTCTITRVTVGNPPVRNDYGEEIKVETVVGTDVPCRMEELYDRELVERFGGGDHAKGIYVVYFNSDANIRPGDLVVIAGNVPNWQRLTSGENNELVVMNVDDAGGTIGHHLEVFCKYRNEIQ